MATEQHSVTAETDRGLKVVPRDHGQFEISNRHCPLQDFDREYVCVSGYFGQYSPELFAAAPELLSIVRRFVALPGGAWHAERHARDEAALMEDARAALAKVGA